MFTNLINIITQSSIDAYVQVVTWVAMTLVIFGWFEKKVKKSKFESKTNPYMDIFSSSMMGALPGCGGAIIVVTRFADGRLSFASLVAVLTSTMGDAAFLLVAQAPLTGIVVISSSVVIGTIYGAIIQWLHPNDYLKPRFKKTTINNHNSHLPKSIINLWFAQVFI